MINRDSWTLDSIVEAYKQDQRRVRGLREATLTSYEQVLRPFLRLSLGEDPLDPTRLTPADVVRFVTSLQERFSARSMKYVRTALRSLFRFLRMKGYCDEKLELSIPAVAQLAAVSAASMSRRAAAQASAGGLRSANTMRTARPGHSVVPFDVGTSPARARGTAP